MFVPNGTKRYFKLDMYFFLGRYIAFQKRGVFMFEQTTLKPESRNNSFSEKNRSEEYSEVISQLKELLENYLERNPNISISSFCIKNNLSKTSVHYLLKGVTRNKISSENARKIVCGMNRGKTIASVLKETKGTLGEFLREKYAPLMNMELEGTYPEDIERTLSTKNARLIMMLAYNKGGTTRREIVETLDKFALEELEVLLSDGVLREDEDGFIKGKSQNIFLNNRITKELIQEVNYFSKPEESPYGAIKVLWGKLSQEKLKKQQKILMEAMQELRELYKEEDINGEPSFVTLTTDLLTQPKVNEREV